MNTVPKPKAGSPADPKKQDKRKESEESGPTRSTARQVTETEPDRPRDPEEAEAEAENPDDKPL